MAHPPSQPLLSRRHLLRLLSASAGVLATGVLAACGAAATSQTQAPVSTLQSTSAVSKVPVGTAASAGSAAPSRSSAAVTSVAPSSAATVASAASVAAGVVQLQEMAWGTDLEKNANTNALTLFMDRTPRIKVEYIHQADDYDNKLVSLIAAGTAPDVYKMSATSYPDLAKAGALTDITSNVSQDSVLGAPEYFIEPFERNRSTFSGKWYGVGSTAQFGLLYYNVDVLNKAGVQPPSTDPQKAWTWDEFVQVGKQLTKTDNGQVTQWGVYYPTGDWLYAALSNGGRDVDPATGKYVLDRPETYDAIQVVADLALKQKVSPSPDALKTYGKTPAQLLASGIIGIVMDGNWTLLDVSKMDFKLGVGVLPKLKQPATLMQSSLTGIYSQTKHHDEAWQLFHYLNLDDYQIQLVKVGLWGASHTDLLTPDGVKKWLTPGVHPEGWSQLETDFKVKYGLAQTVPLGSRKASAAVSAALAPVWTGAKQAHDAAAEATSQGNALLAQGQ